MLEVDHIIPVSKGGTNVDSNLTTACRACNGGKGDVILTEPPPVPRDPNRCQPGEHTYGGESTWERRGRRGGHVYCATCRGVIPLLEFYPHLAAQ